MLAIPIALLQIGPEERPNDAAIGAALRAELI
jgi:hypothetical protein